MTQEQVLTLVRAVLAIVGGMVMAHGWADQNVWTSVGGFAASVVVGAWSWRANSFGLEQYLGIIRNVIATAGGYAVFRGWISADVLAQNTGAVIALATAIWGLYFKTSTPNTPTPPSN